MSSILKENQRVKVKDVDGTKTKTNEIKINDL